MKREEYEVITTEQPQEWKMPQTFDQTIVKVLPSLDSISTERLLNFVYTNPEGFVGISVDIKKVTRRCSLRKAKIPNRKLGVAIYSMVLDQKNKVFKLYTKSTMRTTAPISKIL